jgi:hypothetical protein
MLFPNVLVKNPSPSIVPRIPKGFPLLATVVRPLSSLPVPVVGCHHRWWWWRWGSKRTDLCHDWPRVPFRSRWHKHCDNNKNKNKEQQQQQEGNITFKSVATTTTTTTTVFFTCPWFLPLLSLSIPTLFQCCPTNEK